MRPSFFVLPLLAATVAFGQTQSQSPASQQAAAPVVLQMNHVPMGNCPVGMFAQRRGSSQTIWAISLEDSRNQKDEASARASSTGVHVELHSPGKSHIRQVELAVSFIAPGAYAMLIADNAKPSELKKTFHLAAENGASLKLAGDLLVGPSAGITRVHLLSITYADGKTWNASRNGACSVEPNGFMLVDTH